MWPLLVVFRHPLIQIGLQFVKGVVYLFSEGHLVELLQHRFVEAFADAVGLGATGLGSGMIDIFHGQVELVFVVFPGPAVFRAPIGQHPQQRDVVLLEERQHLVVEGVGGHQGVLAVIKFGEGDLGVGVDEGLLVDAADALEVPT